MRLGSKIRRRLLNGIALKYNSKNILNLILGYLNLNKKPQLIIKRPSDIDFGNIPCFIISLAFRLDRRNKIESLFDRNFTFEYVDAIHGKEINLTLLPEKLISSRSKKYLTKGSIGCMLSHFKAWQFALNRGFPAVFIFEDDIILRENFNDIRNKIVNVPYDFDIVILGSSNKVLVRTNNILNDYYIEPIFPRSGMFAYLINTASINKIFSEVFPIKICAGGLDTIIGHLDLNNKIKAYHFISSLIEADREISSNIINPSVKNKLIHFKEYN